MILNNNGYICIMKVKIKGFENYYCDKLGNIYSNYKKLKPSPSEWGYLKVSLRKDNKSHTKTIHRIIAETFLDNIENKEQVNHIDGNKVNNNLNNLEWVTPKENAIHAVLTGLYTPPKRNREDLSRKILQLDMQEKLITEYPSVVEALRETKLTLGWITRCANGGCIRLSGGKKKWVNCNSIGGYIGRWKDSEQVREENNKL